MAVAQPSTLDDPEVARYIQERVEQYRGWYDRKASSSKTLYLRMRAATVVGGAVVPVLLNLDVDYLNVVTTVISLIVVCFVALESVYHYREQWKNYRSTEQYLGHETSYFARGAGAYRDLEPREAFVLFVDRIESAIAAENAATLNTMALGQQVTEEQGKGG